MRKYAKVTVGSIAVVTSNHALRIYTYNCLKGRENRVHVAARVHSDRN